MVGTNEKNTGTTPRGPVRGVQECVQEWKRKGCESRFRPSHPVRLTPQLLTYLAKLAFSAACSRGAQLTSRIPATCGTQRELVSPAAGVLRFRCEELQNFARPHDGSCESLDRD